MKAITIERRSWKLRCYHCLANNMFVEAEGFEPINLLDANQAHQPIVLRPHFFYYIYIILQIFSKSKSKTIKNKTQVSILSLLRLISGIYVVFNLNSIFYARNNLNDCLSFSHAISLPIKLLEMRGKLLYVFCEIIIFFYLYIFFQVT